MVSTATDGLIVPDYIGQVIEGKRTFKRVVLGSQIPSSERLRFPYTSRETDQNAISGSIGLLDYRVVSAFDSEEGRDETAIEILRIGIEPGSLHEGHGCHMIRWLSKRASQQGFHYLVAQGDTDTRFPGVREMTKIGFLDELRFYRPFIHPPITLNPETGYEFYLPLKERNGI